MEKRSKLQVFRFILSIVALVLVTTGIAIVVIAKIYQINNTKYKDYYVAFETFYDVEKDEFIHYFDEDNITLYHKSEFEYIDITQDFKETIYYRVFNSVSRIYNYGKLTIKDNSIYYGKLKKSTINLYYVKVTNIRGKNIKPTKIIGGDLANE